MLGEGGPEQKENKEVIKKKGRSSSLFTVQEKTQDSEHL